MSRSGYSDYCEGNELHLWRGAVESAIRGKRGQAFLREMRDALDAMPEKVLISGGLRDEHGDVCAMGAVCVKRGLEIPKLDEDDDYGYRDEVAKLLGIAPALAAEIAFMNDDDLAFRGDSPKGRWKYMREWVEENIRPPSPSAPRQAGEGAR